MTSSFLGGIVPPPSPSSSFVTFWLPPLIARVTRDKTAYVGFLTIVEGPLQPVAAMSVTILSFGTKCMYQKVTGCFLVAPPPKKKKTFSNGGVIMKMVIES